MITLRRPGLEGSDERIRRLIRRLKGAARMLEAYLLVDEPYDTPEGIIKRAYGMIPSLDELCQPRGEGVE